MKRKIKVLFVCIHNSARSQMAEALLTKIAGGRFEAFSAGLEPGTLNALAVEVMGEMGIDISNNKTRSVFDYYTSGTLFDYVITVCDGASTEKCPIFPRITKRLHWSFEDPAALAGDHDAKLAATRIIRDEIRVALEAFAKQTTA